MRAKHFLLVVLFVVGFVNEDASANGSLKGRCDGDMRGSPEAVGRNAWARRCGVINKAAEDFYNSQAQYVTFTNIVAPTDERAPCRPDAEYLGACNVAGCYTSTQRVLFDGVYHGIEFAARNDVQSVSSLVRNWNLGDELVWKSEAIKEFVVGDEFKEVLVIESANGNRLEVTSNHPMVTSDGDVVPAANLKEGHSEVLTSGGPSLVISISRLPYQGLVWNLAPESEDTKANIHLAEGFVTGSVRYQNEWAEENSRLHLRENIDTSNF